MTGYCPCCMNHHRVPSRVLGRVGGLAAGAAAGRAFRHPAAPVVGAIFGSVLGYVADRELARRCPDCGDLLQIVADAML